uniref:Transmembrane protein n=1 Tax=Chromera velia CCMP2878 TaxID=1169474 RepID=A0A0G4EYI2_9ALVE|eukprot:Cvel_2539.t1-p1 / transcript=Cvel_2539.t1 / gene=Cvel_2539 / organism=Chromera_velia_CCMP2878 / gene_product=hypothetical protein / transcript_product=hypothetical protein / location=Cvel_scaffold100:62798-67889(-) / protein_length=735 / sequence_SO=supercontig / SO=protein_coding / is_pseudo=false
MLNEYRRAKDQERLVSGLKKFEEEEKGTRQSFKWLVGSFLHAKVSLSLFIGILFLYDPNSIVDLRYLVLPLLLGAVCMVLAVGVAIGLALYFAVRTEMMSMWRAAIGLIDKLVVSLCLLVTSSMLYNQVAVRSTETTTESMIPFLVGLLLVMARLSRDVGGPVDAILAASPFCLGLGVALSALLLDNFVREQALPWHWALFPVQVFFACVAVFYFNEGLQLCVKFVRGETELRQQERERDRERGGERRASGETTQRDGKSRQRNVRSFGLRLTMYVSAFVGCILLMESVRALSDLLSRDAFGDIYMRGPASEQQARLRAAFEEQARLEDEEAADWENEEGDEGSIFLSLQQEQRERRRLISEEGRGRERGKMDIQRRRQREKEKGAQAVLQAGLRESIRRSRPTKLTEYTQSPTSSPQDIIFPGDQQLEVEVDSEARTAVSLVEMILGVDSSSSSQQRQKATPMSASMSPHVEVYLPGEQPPLSPQSVEAQSEGGDALDPADDFGDIHGSRKVHPVRGADVSEFRFFCVLVFAGHLLFFLAGAEAIGTWVEEAVYAFLYETLRKEKDKGGAGFSSQGGREEEGDGGEEAEEEEAGGEATEEQQTERGSARRRSLSSRGLGMRREEEWGLEEGRTSGGGSGDGRGIFEGALSGESSSDTPGDSNDRGFTEASPPLGAEAAGTLHEGRRVPAMGSHSFSDLSFPPSAGRRTSGAAPEGGENGEAGREAEKIHIDQFE